MSVCGNRLAHLYLRDGWDARGKGTRTGLEGCSLVNHLHVLVVSRDLEVVLAARHVMQAAPMMRLVEAATVEEARAALRTRVFDAVVADHVPGALDGIALLEDVRREHPPSCRVLVTGSADIDLAVEAIDRAAIHGFLRKPVEPEEMGGALHRGIDCARREPVFP